MTRRKFDRDEWLAGWREDFVCDDRAEKELRENLEIKAWCVQLIDIAVSDPNAIEKDQIIELYNQFCRELRRVAEDELKAAEQRAMESDDEG